MAYSAEKLLKDLGDKVPSEQAEAAKSAAAETRTAIASGDITKIKAATEVLTKIVDELSTIMYNEAQAKANSQEQGGQDAADETIDADFDVEKK